MRAVRTAAAVLRKELRVLFASPLAWVFLSASLLLAGLLFHLALATTGEASMRPMWPNLAVTLVFCLPLVTMRTFSEETRAGTLELLLTAPVPLGSLVVGKWLAVWALCGVLLALTAPMPAVLFLFGDPDPAALATGYLGMLACCGAFAAVGLFVSSLTSDQMVAGVGTVLLLLPSWLAGVAVPLAPEAWRPALAAVSLTEHLSSFARGALDSADLAWFTGVTAWFLFLCWRSLESRRWR